MAARDREPAAVTRSTDDDRANVARGIADEHAEERSPVGVTIRIDFVDFGDL
jgi:hypothetical protein